MEPPEIERMRRERLAMASVMLATINQHAEVVELLVQSDNEPELLVSIQAVLGCDPEVTKYALDLQLRRLARLERNRLADEIEQLTDDLRGIIPPTPEPISIPPRATLATRPVRPDTSSRPPSDGERARRHEEQQHDRRDMLLAIAEVGADPLPVLTAIFAAEDPPQAATTLISTFGWSSFQATAVLDLQFRNVMPHRLRLIAAEIERQG